MRLKMSKICPFRNGGGWSDDCSTKCALYDHVKKQCYIKTLARHMDIFVTALENQRKSHEN